MQWQAALFVVRALIPRDVVLNLDGAAARPCVRHKGEYARSYSDDDSGTGVSYMGRDIARYMGHEGEPWLWRSTREREESVKQMVSLLSVQKRDVVADIGAGSGYVTFLLAEQVGANGRVIAADLQPKMLDRLKVKLGANRQLARRVRTTLANSSNCALRQGSVDLVLMVDAYHEFAQPAEMLSCLRCSLRPGGRIAFIEYRAEDAKVPILRLHKVLNNTHI